MDRVESFPGPEVIAITGPALSEEDFWFYVARFQCP